MIQPKMFDLRSRCFAEGESISGAVELPARYDGQNVVEIPEGAFKDCRGMTSLIVPDTVQTIGKGAFEGCNNLVDITLPFTGKSAEKASNQGVGCQYVFGWIFGFSIHYSSGSTVSSDPAKNGYPFINDTIEIAGKINQYTTGFSSTRGNWYFSCYNIPTTLRHVTITKQVDIPLAAFNGCTMLEKVTYTNKIMSQGEYAFQNCVSPTEELAGTQENIADISHSAEAILPQSELILTAFCGFSTFCAKESAYAHENICYSVIKKECFYGGNFATR